MKTCQFELDEQWKTFERQIKPLLKLMKRIWIEHDLPFNKCFEEYFVQSANARIFGMFNKFLIDEGNFNTSFDDTVTDQRDIFHEASAINSIVHANNLMNVSKNVHIISVHNLPRMNVTRPLMNCVSVITKNDEIDVNQYDAVDFYTQLSELDTVTASEKWNETNSGQEEESSNFSQNEWNEHGSSSSESSIETMSLDNFDMSSMDLDAKTLQNDQQAIPDANIEQNLLDCKQFQEIEDDSAELQEFLNTQQLNVNGLLLNGQDISEWIDYDYVEYVDDDQSQPKRKNTCIITAQTGNKEKKQKLTEDAVITKRFKCDLCNYQSDNSSNVKRHASTHSISNARRVSKKLFDEKSEPHSENV